MKKSLLILFNIIILSAWAQDTIVGWTFPEEHIESLFANLGTEENLGTPLFFYDEASGSYGSVQIFTDPEGAVDDFIAGGFDWSYGNQRKYWIMSFKASEFGDFHIYSKQRGSIELPGPMNFKIQYSIEDGNPASWTDVEGGSVVCSGSWTSGIVNGINLPEEVNFPEGAVSIRWLMDSDLNINGEPVTASSLSFIDQVLVTAYPNPGTPERERSSDIQVYPNPGNGNVNINSPVEIQAIHIFDCLGKIVYYSDNKFSQGKIMLALEKGIYFMQFLPRTGSPVIKRLLIN